SGTQVTMPAFHTRHRRVGVLLHSAARFEVPLGANVLACPNHMKERFPMNCLKKSKTKARDTEAEPVKAMANAAASLRSPRRASKSKKPAGSGQAQCGQANGKGSLDHAALASSRRDHQAELVFKFKTDRSRA